MSKSKFFALLSTRLGLKNVPKGSRFLNVGVENGADILYKELGCNGQKVEYVSTVPELIGNNYLNNLFEEYNGLVDKILNIWPFNNQLITFGGDHSCSYISLHAVLQRFANKKVGVIMFDSHGDLHTTATSPSGNFHGMWLRTFFDTFHEKQLPCKLSPTQLLFVGNLLLENEEKEFIINHNILTFSSKNTNIVDIINWTKNFDHVHISFDIDVFEKNLVNATGTPNKLGMKKLEIYPILNNLSQLPSFSLDIVEYNPKKDNSDKTLHVIQEVYNLITI